MWRISPRRCRAPRTSVAACPARTSASSSSSRAARAAARPAPTAPAAPGRPTSAPRRRVARWPTKCTASPTPAAASTRLDDGDGGRLAGWCAPRLSRRPTPRACRRASSRARCWPRSSATRRRCSFRSATAPSSAATAAASEVVFWPEQGEYANTTYFVTGADAHQRLRLDVGHAGARGRALHRRPAAHRAALRDAPAAPAVLRAHVRAAARRRAVARPRGCAGAFLGSEAISTAPTTTTRWCWRAGRGARSRRWQSSSSTTRASGWPSGLTGPRRRRRRLRSARHAAGRKIYTVPPSRQGRQAPGDGPAARPGAEQISAWPSRSSTPAGTHVGILLPGARSHAIHELYSAGRPQGRVPVRRLGASSSTRAQLRGRFEAIHAAGHVVGDVNQGNVLVSSRARPAHRLRLVPDRRGARLFTLRRGRAALHAARAAGAEVPRAGADAAARPLRSGRLVFHLLFMGRHPFAGRYPGQGEMPLERAINEFRFAYGRMRGRADDAAAALAAAVAGAARDCRAVRAGVPAADRAGASSAYRRPMKSGTGALEAIDGRLRAATRPQVCGRAARTSVRGATSSTPAAPICSCRRRCWCGLKRRRGPPASTWRCSGGRFKALPPPTPAQPRAPVSMPRPTPAIPDDEMAWAWATVTMGVSALLLGAVSLLMTTTMGPHRCSRCSGRSLPRAGSFCA